MAQTLLYSSNGDGYASSTTLAWQPSEQLEVLANYTYRAQDVMADGAGNTIGNSSFGLPSYLLKAGYTFGDDSAHKVAFSFADTSDSDRDVPYDTFLTTDVDFGNVDRDTETKTAVLSYNYNPTNDLIDLDVILSNADQKIDSTGASGQTGRLAATVNADHRYETEKLTVKNTSLFETGTVEHDLRLGVEFIRKTRLTANSARGGTDDRCAGFAVHNLRTTWVPHNGVLEGSAVRFGLENVFNRKYQPTLSTRPTPGRNFKVTLSKTFKWLGVASVADFSRNTKKLVWQNRGK